MSKEAVPRINFYYTLLSLIFTVSSFISIIRASLKTLEETPMQPTTIVSITISSILFSISIPVTVLLFLSTQGKFLDQISVILPKNAVNSANKWVESFIFNASPVQQFIFIIGSVGTVALLGQSPVGFDTGLFILMLGATVLTIHSVEQKNKLKKRILAIVEKEKRMDLRALSKMTRTSRQNLTSLILDLAADGKPIMIDYHEGTVYLTNLIKPVQETFPIPSEIVQPRQTQTGEICAYCGETNPVPGAKFCIKCGASMVPAK